MIWQRLNVKNGLLRITFMFIHLVVGSTVQPSVGISTLLTSFNDTASIHAQTSSSYSPYYTICTSESLIRTADYSISLAEGEYVEERGKQARQSLIEFLTRVDFGGAKELIAEESVVIGIAVSGGGYRSMLSGAGVLSALDSRTPGSHDHLGGLLQSSTYIAGNSGGSWLVANNLLNDGLPIYDAIRSQSFSSPLIEGIPDVPISQLRATIDAQSVGHEDGMMWESYSRLLNQSEAEKGSLANTLLDTFFKTKDWGELVPSNFSVPNGRKSLDFYKDLNIEVRAKKKAGFQVSLVDYWGRAVSKKIFPPGKKSVEISMSSLAELSSFENFSQLFPIFGSVERLPQKAEASTDSHLFEFNPFEFGSWDSFLNSFVDIRFLGTNLSNGVSMMTTKNEDYSLCVSGYDNMGLITGTSSGLFNTVFQYVYKMLLQLEEQSSSLLTMLLKIFGINSHRKPDNILHPEYALYSPNPFRGITPQNARGREVQDMPSLFLADGGDDGQNIPFHPMLVKGRKLEVVFAFDATSDYENFPNGTTLASTASRYHSSNSTLRLPVFMKDGMIHRLFPYVPSTESFVREDLGAHPIFLGCDLSRDFPIEIRPTVTNQTAVEFPESDENIIIDSIEEQGLKYEEKFDVWEDYSPPIIIYLANYHHSFASNTSTFRTVYTDTEINEMLKNGYNIATDNNHTDFQHCVGCALVKRRADLTRHSAKYLTGCESCFKKFCYSQDRR